MIESEDKQYKKISNIINYYYSNCDLDSNKGTKEKFMRWLANGKDQEEKMRILEELWNQEEGEPDGSAEKILKKIKSKLNISR